MTARSGNDGEERGQLVNGYGKTMTNTSTSNTCCIEVTRDLLIKYDRPGPRYTSYPTVPEWRDDFSGEEYRTALRKAAEAPDAPLSLYVHIPFCRKRCAYCGCNTAVPNDADEITAYLSNVRREVERVREDLDPRRTVSQMHWGGGTPTTLELGQIRALFGTLTAAFRIAPDAEVALEVDPRVTTSGQVELLRELGFNRISMGVQDLDPDVQREIGREQTEEQTRRLFDWCREAGFRGINMDLVYGLPGQHIDTWTRTIHRIIDIGPDRLAVYSFAHLPKQLANQQAIDGSRLPTGPEKYGLFAAARCMLVEAGYRPIGMDHFAKPDDELAQALDERRLNRNFMGYTVVSAEGMIGFGVSAIGEIGGCYAQNEKTTPEYHTRLDRERFAVARGCILSQDDSIRRWVIRQLMCNFHLDTQQLLHRFNVTYSEYFAREEEALREFYEQGFIDKQNGNLRILPLGQVFIRNVAMIFDAYLRKSGSHRQFSRTV